MVRSIKNPKKVKRKSKGAKSKEEGSSTPSIPTKVWQPGVDKLEEGEELHCDPSAYHSLHAFHIGWPCLSFDILRDTLGPTRTEFPQTIYCVAGTQAEKASWNSIGIFKLTQISGKRKPLVPHASSDNESETDNDSSSDEDEEMGDSSISSSPALHLRQVSHEGAQESKTVTCSQAPLLKFGGHQEEGYALDWSPVTAGRLLSGDCRNCIHLWEPTSGTWNVDPKPFTGHTASVEDLQWSPTEADVFASCSVDGSIGIWDVRLGKQPAISVKAHNADVNVISWNRLASCMIASGSDDGTFTIRDLRSIKMGDTVVAHFEYHKHQITSIEWSRHEGSTLAVSSSDNQLTIWDLACERDEEEEAEFRASAKQKVNAPNDIPPQLLFIHQGQKDLKELHWHSQIPDMLISTAADGFNVLMPSNLDTVSVRTTAD